MITDTKVAIIKPRVNLEQAIQGLQITSQNFRIYNDGGSILTITSIVAQAAAPWLTLTPPAPPTFNISPLGFQDVAVTVNWSLAPHGIVTNRLLVTSNVGTNSPYAGGIYIVTVNGPSQSLALGTLSYSNGVVRFVISGPAGSNCVVQASTNLVNWSAISTNPLSGSGTVTITDATAASRNRRFYRALLQ